MTPRQRLLLIAAAAVVAVLAVAYGIYLSVGDKTPTASSGSTPSASPVDPSATPTPTPTAESTADAGAPADPGAPPAIDPYYGQAVAVAADDGSAGLPNGLTVELVSVKETTIAASGIGSTSGPGVEVTVRVTNGSASAAALTPVVNGYAGQERTPLTPDQETPIASSIAASGQSSGSYTFAVDDSDSVIWITVSTAPDSGLVVFEHRR